MDMKKITKVFAVAAGAMLLGAGIAGCTTQPTPICEPEVIEKEVPVEVQIETIVEVPVEVEVDSPNLGLVLEHIYDNDGDISYLTDDLDDDEIELIVDRISFINEIKDLAVKEVDKEIADLVDDEVYTFADNSTVTFDDDDIERIRVQDDADEIIVEDTDFEDSDAELTVTVKFEQDDIKFEADVSVEFRDGEIDDLDLIEIRERD